MVFGIELYLVNKPNYLIFATKSLPLNTIWVAKVKQILDDCGMSEIWTAQSPTSHLSKIVMERLKDQFTQKWNSNLNNSTKGHNYGIFKERIQLETFSKILYTHGKVLNRKS